MTRWLRAHPVPGFVLLAFAISYVVGMPVLMLGSGLTPTRWTVAHVYLPRIGVTYGPAIAALVLARITRVPSAPLELLRRALPTWRDVPLAIAIVAAAAISSAAALLAAGFTGAELLTGVRENAGALAAHLLLGLAIVALGEELGWRGWLLPALVARTTRLRAALSVGVVWGLWHAPAFLAGALPAAMLVVAALGLSILLAAVWELAGRRVFAVAFAHAAVNTPMFFWEQIAPSGDVRLRTAWYLLEATYAGAALLLVAARWRWWSTRSSPTATGAPTRSDHAEEPSLATTTLASAGEP